MKLADVKANMAAIIYDQLPADEKRPVNLLKLNWLNQEAIQRVDEIVEFTGLQPDVISRAPGGKVEWRHMDIWLRGKKYTGKRWHLLQIEDKMIPHLIPAPHIDFFFAEYYEEVPFYLENDVTNLSTSVSYNRRENLIRVGCHFMAANLTSSYLAVKLARGQQNLFESQREYSVLIPILGDEEMNGQGILTENPGPWTQLIASYLADDG